MNLNSIRILRLGKKSSFDYVVNFFFPGMSLIIFAIALMDVTSNSFNMSKVNASC